jgi:N-acylglucosamine-6-phosphate 2-epimerase
MSTLLTRLKGGLIVSCQAQQDEPLHGASHMAVMAQAAAQGGAVAIRCESPQDIRAIRQAVALPLIGLWKLGDKGVYITPHREAALAVAEAGADIIAIDATARPRVESLGSLIPYIRDTLKKPVMADVSSLDEGVSAQLAGASLVGTTLAGYTGTPPATDEPDWALLKALVGALAVPVILEGRVWTPEQAKHGLELGAWAVVVGSAITRPQMITRRFAQALESQAHA